MYGVLGNANGLLSLAMHLATLAQRQVSFGTSVSYEPTKELEGGSLPLVLQKSTFRDDAPWLLGSSERSREFRRN